MDNLLLLVNNLRSTLARMEQALGTVDEAIVWTDEVGRIRWCNAAFDRLIAKPHILVLGRSLPECIPLLDRDLVSPCEKHPAVMALELGRGVSTYGLCRDNTIIVLEITWAPLHQQQTEQSIERGAVLTIRDVTERHRAEIALRESKVLLERKLLELEQAYAQLRLTEKVNQELKILKNNVLDSISAGYWDWDIRGNQKYYSPGFKRALGYEEDELSNSPETWKALIVPEDLPKVLDSFDQHVRNHDSDPFSVEVRYRHKNGSLIWIACSGKVIEWDAEGNPLRAIGCHTDITDRKRTEATLQAKTEELDRFFSVSLDLMSVISEHKRTEAILQAKTEELDRFFSVSLDLLTIATIEGRFLRLNTQWEKTLGYPLSDLEGRRLLDYVHPEDLDETIDAISTLKDGQEVLNFVNRYRCYGGSYCWLEWRAVPVGSLIYAAARDITDRRNAELALEQAKEEAEAATLAKAEFLATMSHEIRTPMNGVIGMTGLLLETVLEPKQRDFVETIRVCGDTLLTIINDILDISKLEAGEVELESLSFNLRECLEEVVELLATSAHTKGLEIGVLIEPTVPIYVQGDVTRLRQILINLVGNAIKFTEQGEVTIQVTCQVETDWDCRVQFSVKDTGVGLSEAEQAKLFQPFTQADTSTTRKYGGTGLGLAICKKLVELMEGRIGLESQAGQGSCFWFVLPFEKCIPPPTTKLALTRRHLEGLRLLIVDDNQTNREILRNHAISWGIQIEEAENAATALAKLRQQSLAGKPFDLAFLDMNMPDMNGEELGRAIKTDPVLTHVQLVLLSSHSFTRNRQELLNVVFADSVVKPVRQSRLFDCLMTVVNSETRLQLQGQKDISGALLLNAESQAKLNKLKILLVEDSSVNQKVVLNQLSSIGCQANSRSCYVDVVANGQEALDLIAQIQYDLVLMDCRMPVMDGYEATRRIRAQEHPPHHLKIIALTANALKEDRDRCLAAGMDDYLSKPIKKSELIQKILLWGLNQPLPLEPKIESQSLVVDLVESSCESTVPPDHANDLSIDWDYLRTFSEDPALVQEILATIGQALPEYLETLRMQIEVMDYFGIEQTAHLIKGSSGSVGVVGIQTVAAEIEAEAEHHCPDRLPHLFSHLIELMQQLEQVLSNTNLNPPLNYWLIGRKR